MIYLSEDDWEKDGRPFVYHKVCKNPKCGREFMSTSRNQKYCCQDCADVMRVVTTKKSNVRRKKRVLYDKNKEINRALSKAYTLAHDVAELYKIPHICAEAIRDPEHKCTGELQLHHKDLNPFNNAPDNLEFVCVSGHKTVHDRLGDVNMVDTYNEAIDEAGFADEDKKSECMVSYTMNKIREARKS